VLLLLGAAALAAGETSRHFGDPFRGLPTTAIGELGAHPDAYFNHDVRIEGIVASVCAQEGCFIEVVPEAGRGEGILVNFPGATPGFPTDCAGARAVVEGMFYQKVYPASRVSHWQGHSFRPGKTVPPFSRLLRLTAKAADVSIAKGTVPAPGDIVAASPDRLDLATMEFEADGFGAGRKSLQPGEATERHSTGGQREMIFCLQGEITVLKPPAAPVVLRAGEMSFIPPQTEHEIRNTSDHPALYLFVFSRAPEPAEEKHAH
jgi:quercetin dioxygenase-like cupin family protein